MSYSNRTALAAVALIVLALAALVVLISNSCLSCTVNYVLSPPRDLTVGAIILISFILGMLHGATPDEHTWPITFSYAVGSYSTRKGMKAGLAFSAGFTAQRALLTTLGFLGLAAVYTKYNLDGPVYVLVGIAMVISGAYILRKRIYLHLPLDVLFRGSSHHTEHAERVKLHEAKLRQVPMKMAAVHGLIAGFGFGAYATIITFILAPQLPSLIYAPLPGLFFGIGTMITQIIFGALFANLVRLKRMGEEEIAYVGRRTAGRTLYYGGMMFAVIGLLVIFFPAIENFAVATGNPIPNLDSISVATMLVLVVVGIFGIGNLLLSILEIMGHKKSGRIGKT